MKYNLRSTNYRNFKVFADNKCNGRAYFIPFGDAERAKSASVGEKRYVSDKVVVLNGEWDFAYFRSLKEFPLDFDTDNVAFDTVKVPSCWQLQGYEPPFYTNIKYPFPVVPPMPPVERSVGKYGEDINGFTYKTGKKQYNSKGVYRRFVTIDDLNRSYIISFLGVASCLELYVNGKYVGYSEGSHNTAEFVLDGYLSEGNNEILAVVHKWCNGSYLEDQDFFRYNGIFRDVLLFVNYPSFIYDFEFFTAKSGDLYDAILTVNVRQPRGNLSLTAKLSDGDKTIAYRVAAAKPEVRIAFEQLDVAEWNAEVPKLYDLTLTLTKDGFLSECICKKVGFKTVEITGRVFKVNGVPVKLRGVNHHDTHPKTGWVMTAEEIEKDVKLCKEYNVNAVRTSHYPPDPMFLEFADQYGLYIIDEADIETHGTKTPGQISENLRWKEHYWDRVKRMYLRDRNSPSVVMWSLGNESGGIRCQDYCYRQLKALSMLPIHYERAIETRRGAYDVASEMYPPVERLPRIARKNIGQSTIARRRAMYTKPYFMCEYAHAMGVGAGNLKEYWEEIYKYDNLLGGCIWEMVDHAVDHGEGAKYRYTYGGDHGEYTHDGNFCVDGLFYPDRTPHTGALSMKNVYRPVRAALAEEGVIELTNYNNFRNTAYLTAQIALNVDGTDRFRYTLDCDIDPGTTRRYDLGYAVGSGDAFLNIRYFDGEREVANEQLELSSRMPNTEIEVKGRATVSTTSETVTVNFDEGSIRFAKESGGIISYKKGETSYLVDAPLKEVDGSKVKTTIYRAPIDNDLYIKKAWEKAGYDDCRTRTVSVEAVEHGADAVVTVRSLLTDAKDKVLFEVLDVYRVNAAGVIDLTSELIPRRRGLPMLPKFGKVFALARDFDDVIYYGSGPYESYPDFKEQNMIGIYRDRVGAFTEPYIRPQESGNRTDVRYFALRNAEGEGLMFAAVETPFSFQVRHFSDRALASFKHREDIVEENVTYCSVLGAVSGVGSNSCGPLPLKRYCLDPSRRHRLHVRILPFRAEESAIDYAAEVPSSIADQSQPSNGVIAQKQE